MLHRLLRGETHGDLRPFEQLLPGLATATELGSGAELTRNQPQADARLAGLLRAAAALARPGDNEDGGVALQTNPALQTSIRALFDYFLYRNSVHVLKPLLYHGSDLIRRTIGGLLWAPRVMPVREARRYAPRLLVRVRV